MIQSQENCLLDNRHLPTEDGKRIIKTINKYSHVYGFCKMLFLYTFPG
ncbi:MAG: hypothetical protein AB2421_07995 [Thermotaleaceae bacterium]